MDYTNFTIPELFQKLSIGEIQSLSSTYKTQAVDAKVQLQSLVSDNYRDIIGITDEINNTHKLTQNLSKSLSSLAYSKSNFVSFKRVSKSTRQINKKAIANIIIHDELTEFDLRLNNDLPSHTSEYVTYAKIYHILGTFDAIKNNNLLKSKFERMKTRFINTLNDLISTYNVPLQSVYTRNSDTYVPSHHLKLSDMVSNQPVDVINESDLEFLDIDESSGELPIYNYLLAYIIITGTITKSPALFHFLELRVKHLNKVIGILKSKNWGTKFSPWKIVRYIENTMGYVSVFNQLSKFKLPLVLNDTDFGKFNNEAFKGDLSDLQTEINDFQATMMQQVTTIFSLLIASSELGDVMTIFINFMASFQKLSTWCEENGFKSVTHAQLKSNDCIQEMIKTCKSRFPPILKDLHSILEQITDYSVNENLLFTNELVDMIHNDMNSYFNFINTSAKSSLTTIDTAPVLHQWFTSVDSYKSLIDIEGQQLSKLLDYSNNSRIVEGFKQLSQDLALQIDEELSKFIDSLHTIVKKSIESSNTDHVYYLLTVLVILNQKSELHDQISPVAESCYSYIFTRVHNTDLDNQLEAIFTSLANETDPVELDSIQVSLKLSTLFYSLSTQIINPQDSRSSDYIYSIIASDPAFTIMFKQSQNKWLTTILDKIYDILQPLEVQQPGKYKVFANLCFLGNFIGMSPDMSRLNWESNDIDFKEIELSIKDYYNACSNTYYPLNI
ncbi:hypothetical protein CLIB1444_05S05050 [[Candida] jaroonii]|uniref:Uncharacterized protein n=1 Tax=[Candida] jaroonii TaxID=467808 RepID=A0ACA9Y9R3_9ASCO|nr:hypothetical protein CLIB1444_05S05050 [[Candida] jaroonii]